MAHRSNDGEGQSAPHHLVRVPRDTVLERGGARQTQLREAGGGEVCAVSGPVGTAVRVRGAPSPGPGLIVIRAEGSESGF